MYGQKKLWFGSASLFLALVVAMTGCQQTNAPTGEEGASGAAGQPPASAPSGQSAAGQASSSAPRASQPAARTTAPPRSIMLDAGTALKVRTTNTISTASHKPGDTFAASLEEPLMYGNVVVAPKGASVMGKVVEADAGGRVQGVAHITVALDSIETAEGQKIALDTDPIRIEAQSTVKKDATKVGIATGIGAAIGAIAGGGKGAAIGAATGAGAGTGVVLATRGDAAEIPSESVLDFKLASPATATEARE